MASEGPTSLAVVLAFALLATTAAGLATADPPDEPDHGVNESTFPVLWSGDVDGNVSSGGDGDNDTGAIRQFANGTDVPRNSPSADVERWTDGEIDEFPSTNRSVSIQPTGANTVSGRGKRDSLRSSRCAYPIPFQIPVERVTAHSSSEAHILPSHQPILVYGRYVGPPSG